ncbi:MAG: hypothetical protein P1P87_10740, partial [Trueperaceae bacterium]|nr:hypothetical protein [Trueperaceae bacterium]
PRASLPPMRTLSPAILKPVIDRWTQAAPGARSVGSCVVLAILDHPDQVTGLTVDRAVGIASRWGIGAGEVVVKPHPRDPRSMTVITEGHGVGAIEAKWPVETTFSSLRSGAIVLGGNSSGMLLAAVLRPDLDLRLRAKEDSALWRLLTSIDARARLEPISDG